MFASISQIQHHPYDIIIELPDANLRERAVLHGDRRLRIRRQLRTRNIDVYPRRQTLRLILRQAANFIARGLR